MKITIEKKELEKVLRDEIYEQKKRAEKLSNNKANSKEECIRRQELINKYEIMEILFSKLGITNQIMNSVNRFDEVEIK